MPYYNLASLVTLTKMSMINEMVFVMEPSETTDVRIWYQVSR